MLIFFLPVEESCNELKAKFVRVRPLNSRFNVDNSADETRAGVLFSRLRIEVERLEKLMFQEDHVLDMELEKPSEFSTNLNPNGGIVA